MNAKPIIPKKVYDKNSEFNHNRSHGDKPDKSGYGFYIFLFILFIVSYLLFSNFYFI